MEQKRLDEIRERCAEFLEWLEDGTEFREIEKHGKALAADVPDLLDEVSRLTAEISTAREALRILRPVELSGDAVTSFTLATENSRLTAELAEMIAECVVLREEAKRWQNGHIIAKLTKIEKERDAWKARAEAAEQDLNALRKRSGWKCYACHYDNHSDRDVCVGCGYNDGNNWRWRGPVEGGEGV